MFWQCRTTLKSYTIPVIKIFISVFVIIVLLFRNKIFSITNKTIQIIISIIAFFILIFLILCIYVSVAELFYVYENKKNEAMSCSTMDKSACISKTLMEVMQLTNNNDIIEIIIVTGGGIVKVGSSSDYKHSTGDFFDKKYYINKTEYTQSDDFSKALEMYIDEGFLWVYSIDGVVV